MVVPGVDVFAKPEGNEHAVYLVLGNDLDIISDWNFTDGDPDGFNAAMEAFDTDKYS